MNDLFIAKTTNDSAIVLVKFFEGVNEVSFESVNLSFTQLKLFWLVEDIAYMHEVLVHFIALLCNLLYLLTIVLGRSQLHREWSL